MPIFHVYELQEEIHTRRWLYEVEAPDEKSAISLAEDGWVGATDCGLFEEPFFRDSGFAAQPPDVDSATGWDQALINLESVKADGEETRSTQKAAGVQSTVVEAIEAALNYFEDTRHGREWIETGGVEADMLRDALKSLHAIDSKG